MKSSTLYRWLEWTFQPQTCTEVFPVIGLQEDNTEEITRVYTATFASPEVFEQVERLDANTCMLFTHHPKPQRLNTADPPPQIPQKWLDFLKERRISLFTYHIPLDRNSPFSPGVNLARALGAEPYDSFFEQNLVRMGVVCTSPFSTATELAQAMERVVWHAVKLYSYAEDVLSRGRFAIMAGGAKNTQIYEQLRDWGVNTFITGVTNPEVPWVGTIHEAAKASAVNLLGGTHYSTEKFAPMQMCRYFEVFGLPSEFLPETPRMTEL